MTDAVETSALCHSLQQGKFCYVVEKKGIKAKETQMLSKQSSLCQQTQAEMENRGYYSIVLQLRSLTDRASKAQSSKAQSRWSQQFIAAVWHSLHPADHSRICRWLATTAELSERDRLIAFTSDLLFNEICATPFVVFIEDIDALLSLPSALEDILFWIDHCYELRDTYLTYHHLSFAVFSSNPIDQIIASTPDFLSDFEGAIKTFQRSDAGQLDSLASQSSSNHPGTNSGTSSLDSSIDRRLDDLPNRHQNSHCNSAVKHSTNDIKPASGRQRPDQNPTSFYSQYAREIARMQIPAHRFRYDPPGCSRTVC